MLPLPPPPKKKKDVLKDNYLHNHGITPSKHLEGVMPWLRR